MPVCLKSAESVCSQERKHISIDQSQALGPIDQSQAKMSQSGMQQNIGQLLASVHDTGYNAYSLVLKMKYNYII